MLLLYCDKDPELTEPETCADFPKWGKSLPRNMNSKLQLRADESLRPPSAEDAIDEPG